MANPAKAERRLTAEFTVNESDEPKLNKLIAYARRLGLDDPFQDSWNPELEDTFRRG